MAVVVVVVDDDVIVSLFCPSHNSSFFVLFFFWRKKHSLHFLFTSLFFIICCYYILCKIFCKCFFYCVLTTIPFHFIAPAYLCFVYLLHHLMPLVYHLFYFQCVSLFLSTLALLFFLIRSVFVAFVQIYTNFQFIEFQIRKLCYTFSRCTPFFLKRNMFLCALFLRDRKNVSVYKKLPKFKFWKEKRKLQTIQVEWPNI